MDVNKLDKDGRILLEIYKRMYAESDPPVDIMKIIESGEGQQDRWYMNYYLAEQRQLEIIDEVLKEFKVKPKWKRNAFKTTVLLGASPTSIKRENENKNK